MISVIMSCYQEKCSIIELAIKSILNQSYTNFEFIIIVDAPERNDIIELIGSFHDIRIRCYVNSENMGLVKSLNKALALAKGEYIARMDADDISVPNRLAWQMEYLTRNKLDLIGGYYQEITEEGKCGVIRKTSNLFLPVSLQRYCCLGHPTYFASKTFYEEMNGYREITTCEDYDLLLRALKQKKKIGVLPKICLYYRISSNGITRKNTIKQRAKSLYLLNNISRIMSVNNEEIDEYYKTEKGKFELDDIREFLLCKEMMINKKVSIDILAKLIFNRYFYISIYNKMAYIIFDRICVHFVN